MTGALGNVGIDQYALPADTWTSAVLPDVVDEVLDQKLALREHLARLRDERRGSQELWWDALVAAIRGDGWRSPASLEPAPVFQSGAWSQRVLDTRGFAEQNWRARAALKRSTTEVAQLTNRLEQANRELTEQSRRAKRAEQDLQRLRRSFVVQLSARLRRILRPARRG